MAGENIILFPKYTTLVGSSGGGTEYFSDPYDVTGYKALTCDVLLVVAIGTSPVVTAMLQQSDDLTTWTNISSETELTAGTVSTLTKNDPARYIRCRIEVSGTSPAATLWAKAVARDC